MIKSSLNQRVVHMSGEVDVLKAISDDTRLSMVCMLLNHDICTGAVARRLGISEAAVSQHMKVLRDAGLVTPERRGYFTHYSVDRSRLTSLAEMLISISEAERHPCNPDFEGCTHKRRGRCPTGTGGSLCPKQGTGEDPCPGCIRCLSGPEKEEGKMKVAVTYENGEVFQHFGRTAEFKVYEIEDGQIVSSEVVSTMGRGHGELIGVIKGLGASTLICGGLGAGARNGLIASGVNVLSGNSGDADEVVRRFASGDLVQCSEATCDHHGHEDHECTCGRH